MAAISGTSGNDTIQPGGVSAGVTGGVPGSANDIIFGSAGSDSLDGGGSNTLDYSALAGPILLTSGSTAYAGTVTKPAGTDSFANINIFVGTGGSDTLIGTTDLGTTQPRTISLRGGAGNDLIDGAKSSLNNANYQSSTAGISASLQTSTDADGNWFGTAQDGLGGTDTLKNVLRVKGSAYDDTILGSDRFDVVDGSLGSDRIDLGAGYNTVR